MDSDARKTILLVEDEAILAMSGKMTLEKGGYTVLLAGSGEQALAVFRENPDIHLILMDIDLGTGMDGTECASLILGERNVPVVFLSSHTEPDVVEKTEKITSYGYVVKNSGNTVLFASINMAFKLFEANRHLEEEKEHLTVTLNSIGEAIIATDIDGKVTRMNPVAEKMTAYTFLQVKGKPVDAIFSIKNPETGEIETNPVRKVIESGLCVELKNHVVLQTNDGTEFRIADSASPIRNVEGKTSGVVFAFRDVSSEFQNVAALKEAEERLNKSYLLLKSSIESPQDMIILSIDRDYNYLYFNSYHKKVMLAAYGTDVQSGMNLIDCITNAADIRKARSNYDRALAGEGHITVEEYGDQERSWFETRYNPVLDEDGRVIGATAFSSNVTARVLGEIRLNEALAESQRFRDMNSAQRVTISETENRYRSLFENNHSVMLIIDPVDGLLGDVNQAACDFYGWPRETLLQMKLDQINILSPEEVRDEMARAVVEKRKNFHFCQRKADGKIVDVDVHAGTIELEGKTWILAVVHDMTEKIAALKEKEDLGKRLSHYLATSPTITYSVRFYEGHDHWQWVSENAGTILGYTTEEIMKPDWWFDNLHPVDRPRVLSAIAKLSGDNSVSLEYRFLRKNRTILWLRDQKRWITSIGGDLEIVGSLTDISECKAIEDELIQKSIALESTANPMIITDISGEIEWVNKAFMRFTGYSQEESLGKNPKELIGSGEQSTDFYRKMWGVILSGNTWRGQIVNRKKNGEFRTEELTVTPVPDQTGHISHFIAETNDITERIRVEKELQKFELLLKSTLESPKEMNILSIDTEYRYLCFNTCHKNTMFKSYGIDIKPGMNILECITDEDDRRRAERSFGRAFTGESFIALEDYGALERICYETRYNPTIDDKQRIIGTTAFSIMKERNK